MLLPLAWSDTTSRIEWLHPLLKQLEDRSSSSQGEREYVLSDVSVCACVQEGQVLKFSSNGYKIEQETSTTRFYSKKIWLQIQRMFDATNIMQKHAFPVN
jgi:hypothetical protein